MICPNPNCRQSHLALMHPVFTFSLKWVWRRLRFEVRGTESGDMAACWNCGESFVVTRKGETIQRVQASPAKPRVVGLRKTEEPEPRQLMKDEDMAEAPQW